MIRKSRRKHYNFYMRNWRADLRLRDEIGFKALNYSWKKNEQRRSTNEFTKRGKTLIHDDSWNELRHCFGLVLWTKREIVYDLNNYHLTCNSLTNWKLILKYSFSLSESNSNPEDIIQLQHRIRKLLHFTTTTRPHSHRESSLTQRHK